MDPHLKHMIMMILACGIPLVIIALLPRFGVSPSLTTIGAIGLMILLHVWMMKDHFSHQQQRGIK